MYLAASDPVKNMYENCMTFSKEIPSVSAQ